MDADARKTTLRMIPYGLYVLTSIDGDSVGAGTVNWVTDVGLRTEQPEVLTLKELGLNYGG
jgi:flavin reductase (DIM6/NTAB) family NADH-FMN oxidoreductase RutF